MSTAVMWILCKLLLALDMTVSMILLLKFIRVYVYKLFCVQSSLG